MHWPPSDTQHSRDVQHLNLLAVFHYIYGGLVAISGCVGPLIFMFGLAMFADPTLIEDDEPLAYAAGMIMFIVGGCSILLSLATAGLIIYAGTCLSNHRYYIFCMIIAVLMCLSIPFGTIPRRFHNCGSGTTDSQAAVRFPSSPRPIGA